MTCVYCYVATCKVKAIMAEKCSFDESVGIFQLFVITLQRLVVDHLPGGMYNSVVDPQIIQETKSVPNTNVTPQRDFAVLDRLMTQKPNATYIALESLLLYSHNKTVTWLKNKTIEEKRDLCMLHVH